MAREFWASGLSRSPRAARPGSDGAFRFVALTPGEYYVAVATDFDQREVFGDAFLEPLVATGVKLAVAPGEQKIQDLRIGRRRP